MALEVRDLRLVEAVAQCGSLTRAGTMLHLTQSALSHQLADLERRLATPVFLRTGKRMVLTPAGERLREAARTILGTLAQAERDVHAVGQERSLLLRLSTECYTCYHWLPGVLREYQRRFPTVEPRIVAEATRRPLPALFKGQLDVAIVTGPERHRRLEVAPLFRDELVAVVAPDHPWAARRFVVADDFADQHLIGYTLVRSESTIFREVLVPAGVLPRHESQVELTEAIVELVKAGSGVTVLARWAVAPHVDAGTLATIRVTERGLQRQWYAAMLRHKTVPPHFRGFVTLLSRGLVPRSGAELSLLKA